MRSLRERSERLTAAASDAWANLEQARTSYGAEPSTAQRRALETLQAEYDRAAGEAGGADSEYRDALARLDGSGPGGEPAAGARRIGELRSYGRGDDLRARMRDDGPRLGEIVRAMATGDARPLEAYGVLSSGVTGALPEYEVLGIVEQALQESVIFGAGARLIPMNAPKVKLARVTSTPDVEIAPEAADRDLTDQAPGFTSEEMDAHSAFLYCTATLESIEDVANLEETIVSVFSGQLSRAWDKYALGGDGNTGPLGVGYMFEQDGAHEVDATGTALTGYLKFVEAIGRVRTAHHKPSAVVLDVPTWTALAMLTDQTDQPLVPPKAYSELSEYVSDFMPLDPGGTSSAAVGDFSRLLVGVRTNLQIEVDRMGTGLKTGHVAIRARMRWGSFCDDPSAFAIIRGLDAGDVFPSSES